MKRFLLAFLLLTACGALQDSASEHTQRVLEQAALELIETHNVPGVAVGLIEDGVPTDIYTFGLADKTTGIPITSDTGFNVGSISKTITAWAVMHLVERGLVDLDTSYEKYVTRWRIPTSEFDASKVTVRSLLNHTSGLAQWAVPQFEAGEQIPLLETSLSDDKNLAGERAVLGFEPGTQWRYSGAGYSLLQLLIEEVSGESYASFVNRVIFKPLGMQDSSFILSDDVLQTSAKGYDASGDETALVRFAAISAAGLHTTPGDLAKFAAAALPTANGESAGRQMLSSQSIHMMTRTEVSASSSDANVVNRNYGLGYFVINETPRFFGHGGDNRGWHARIVLYPETNNGFVILTNSSNGFAVAEALNCHLGIQLGNASVSECPT